MIKSIATSPCSHAVPPQPASLWLCSSTHCTNASHGVILPSSPSSCAAHFNPLLQNVHLPLLSNLLHYTSSATLYRPHLPGSSLIHAHPPSTPPFFPSFYFHLVNSTSCSPYPRTLASRLCKPLCSGTSWWQLWRVPPTHTRTADLGG